MEDLPISVLEPSRDRSRKAARARSQTSRTLSVGEVMILNEARRAAASRGYPLAHLLTCKPYHLPDDRSRLEFWRRERNWLRTTLARAGIPDVGAWTWEAKTDGSDAHVHMMLYLPTEAGPQLSALVRDRSPSQAIRRADGRRRSTVMHLTAFDNPDACFRYIAKQANPKASRIFRIRRQPGVHPVEWPRFGFSKQLLDLIVGPL